ncbi:MAG: SdpA family antimicrobial peptide system protein [Cyclobacteriaceae bacterium]|nr:SdpA family antimicrobial peptide system protein [Cyclobacteriaceae bacterium]
MTKLNLRFVFLWSTLLFNVFLWLLFIAFTFSAVAPYNTTSYKFLNKRESLIFRSFFPEGFGFFTRDPNEEFPLLYKEVNDSLVLLTKANSSSSNLFGLKRTQRSVFGEMGSIISEIPSEDWTKCATTLKECLSSKKIKVVEISNTRINTNFCGTYFITTKKPVPWAWRETFKGEMPQRFVKLIIRCEK